MKFQIGKRLNKTSKKDQKKQFICSFVSDTACVNTVLYDINQTDDYGRTALFNAAQQGDVELVKQLLESGADPNIPDNKLIYPIHDVIDNGNMDILNLLIDNECDINCKNLLGQTPLIRATLFSDSEAVKTLVKAGADLDDVDDSGRSALLNGLLEGCDRISCYLIKSGCDVNIVDNDGQSALYLSTHRSSDPSISVCQKLYKAGYDFVHDCEWLEKDLYKTITGMGPLRFVSNKLGLLNVNEMNSDFES